VAFGPTVWKSLSFKVFMNSKVELNHLLFWKKYNFPIACPNATKQSLCTPLCMKLSIHIRNATSNIASKPLNFFHA